VTYEEAIAYLNGLINYERVAPDAAARARFSLDPVREVAARLGDPQLRFKAVHVAGTKGKGSVCAFVEAVLRAAGLRTGFYSSPHLCDFRERMRLNGRMIAPDRLAAVVERCRPFLTAGVSRFDASRPPTYFEALTQVAFLWFAEQGVEAAVVETGLGGRADATTIVVPVGCGLTSISRDHMRFLGESLAEIAGEKAGIIKPAVPVVSAPQPAEAEKVFVERARALNAPLERLGVEISFRETRLGLDRELSPTGKDQPPEAEVVFSDGRTYRAEPALWGAHQIVNWALAMRLADIAYQALRGTTLPEEAVRVGSAATRWPGRLEEAPWVSGPRVFLDGAHNDASVAGVFAALKARLPHRVPTAVFGCAADKDVPAMMAILAQEAHGAVFTDAGHPRSASPKQLAEEWRRRTKGFAACVEDPLEALSVAKNYAGKSGCVLALGSLYLVGRLRKVVGLEEEAP
jgi:dihydrofolate synthase/folylpolyglutamate synthase